MISQADIIRSLVNKNCTDESVMSTALSQACTPPKLLEKLTEAERFDLAIDISMKLGMDVVLLWKTWAMRCLRNRNFQAAREKFRHCFVRVRLPGNRVNPTQSNILNEILNELTRMDEKKLSLVEEIELIKKRKSRDETLKSIIAEDYTQSQETVLCKPTIYTECTYYLKEYGNLQDNIRFYAKNFLWNQAVTLLLEKSNNQVNLNKFFVSEVVQYSTSTGRFNDLIKAFLDFDPTFKMSATYLKLIYNFCSSNRRYNLLYYVQNLLGDYIAAANTQIDFFFLRRPINSYTCLEKRLTNLILARNNYQDYLEKFVDKGLTDDNQITTTLNEADRQNSGFFTFKSRNEVEKQIETVDLQIDITRNFALNEVSGCIGGIELGSNRHNNAKSKDKTTAGINSKHNPEISKADDSPATMFDKSEVRKTFLAALVLIYYDLSFSTYFSKNGLDLANQVIDNQGLDKLQVFKTAMRVIIEDENCDTIENSRLLLERIKEDCQRSNLIKQQQSVTMNKKEFQLGLSSHANVNANSEKVSVARGGLTSSSKRHMAKTTTTKQHSTISTTDGKDVDARSLCDDVIRDGIKSCREPDFKMELAGLLSSEARIRIYIEHGNLSNAQRLAFKMNRADYVLSIIEEAVKLNQDHVKTVCELWLAKHETRNSTIQ